MKLGERLRCKKQRREGRRVGMRKQSAVLNDFDFEVVTRRHSVKMVLMVLWMRMGNVSEENTHTHRLQKVIKRDNRIGFLEVGLGAEVIVCDVKMDIYLKIKLIN